MLHRSFTSRWKWVLRGKSLTLITDLQDDSYTAKMKHIHEAPQERSMVLGFREIRLYIFLSSPIWIWFRQRKKWGRSVIYNTCSFWVWKSFIILETLLQHNSQATKNVIFTAEVTITSKKPSSWHPDEKWNILILACLETRSWYLPLHPHYRLCHQQVATASPSLTHWGSLQSTPENSAPHNMQPFIPTGDLGGQRATDRSLPLVIGWYWVQSPTTRRLRFPSSSEILYPVR